MITHFQTGSPLRNALAGLALAGCLGSSVLCAESPADLAFKVEEVVSRSFPPNLNWLNDGQPGFDPRSFATFAPGQWAEYVLPVPEAGTYRIKARATGGDASGVVRLFVDGDPQGDPADLYAAAPRSPLDLDWGDVTFLKPGKSIFRLRVEGKNPKSEGCQLEVDSIRLTRETGFTLVAPEGARFDEPNPVLQWSDAGPKARYTVYLDDAPLLTTDATFRETKNLSAGEHRWHVVAQDGAGRTQRSNTFHFTIGPPSPYPDRDFTVDFASGDLARFVNQGMTLEALPAQGKESLAGSARTLAYVKDVRLGVREGEVSTLVSLDEPGSCASVGFTQADGARVCATIDCAAGTLNLERTVPGYSIFAITPPAYRMAQWTESRTSDGAYRWQIASVPAALKPGVTYRVKLAYSRRSCAVMATLTEADESNLVTLRGLVDINLPDHPMVEVGEGKAHFEQLSYRQLNRHVYPWDIDTNQIVLRPGPAGSWDSRGAFNNAVLVKNDRWYMVYRGNSVPAPPNGRPNSELGVATSTDGVHWTKEEHNPIITRSIPADSKEDPDLLQPAGTDVTYLEYVSHAPIHKEVMASSTDGLHYSEPWDLPVKGKIGGMIDTHSEPQIPEFDFEGRKYRYLAAIEEGGIYLSNDLHQWDKMGTTDYSGHPDRWCNAYECAGDIFVDADQNLRVEAQAGTKIGVKTGISGNPLCTNVEDVLSSRDPTKVIARGDLPWLPDFYGDAPTGDLNEMTFTNGSVFPGQTVVKDGYLWHYYGGNNTFTGLIKSVYRPVFVYRDLHVSRTSGPDSPDASVDVTVRNEGSFSGVAKVDLRLDGAPAGSASVTLARDEERRLTIQMRVPPGRHTVAIDTLRAAVCSGDHLP